MKKYLLLLIVVLSFAFYCCERQEESISNNSRPERWHCIGQNYEFVGNITDTLYEHDPVGNPVWSLAKDSMFIIDLTVYPNQNYLFSKVVNYDTFALFFKDNTWLSYSFPTTYGYPVFELSGFGSDSSSISPLTPVNQFKILKHTTDTLSIKYIYTGPWPDNLKMPYTYYMFTKVR